MKKVIKNRLYDTATAHKVADYSTDEFAVNDFHWYAEELYKKRTGEYFIYGRGNALSPYSKPYPGGGSQSGESIIPLDYEQARAWAEDNMDADDYMREFDLSRDDDDSTVPTHLKLSAQARAALDQQCAKSGKTRSEIINELLLRSE